MLTTVDETDRSWKNADKEQHEGMRRLPIPLGFYCGVIGSGMGFRCRNGVYYVLYRLRRIPFLT
jgi:hypothetical protein